MYPQLVAPAQERATGGSRETSKIWRVGGPNSREFGCEFSHQRVPRVAWVAVGLTVFVALFATMPGRLIARPYIDMGSTSLLSGVNQPYVRFEMRDGDVVLGPASQSNTFLLDSGSTSILAVGPSAEQLHASPGDFSQGQFLEQGLGGFVPYHVSAPLTARVQGDQGLVSLEGTRILTDPNGSLAAGATIDGVVGMPAMVGRVTSLDMSSATSLGGGLGLDGLLGGLLGGIMGDLSGLDLLLGDLGGLTGDLSGLDLLLGELGGTTGGLGDIWLDPLGRGGLGGLEPGGLNPGGLDLGGIRPRRPVGRWRTGLIPPVEREGLLFRGASLVQRPPLFRACPAPVLFHRGAWAGTHRGAAGGRAGDVLSGGSAGGGRPVCDRHRGPDEHHLDGDGRLAGPGFGLP